MQQPFTDFLLRPGGAFVDEHDIPDGQPLGLAPAEEFRRRPERQRQLLLGLVELLLGRVLFAFADNEAAPTEKKVAVCSSSPPASETVNVMPLVCRGRMVSGRRMMSLTP